MHITCRRFLIQHLCIEIYVRDINYVHGLHLGVSYVPGKCHVLRKQPLLTFVFEEGKADLAWLTVYAEL